MTGSSIADRPKDFAAALGGFASRVAAIGSRLTLGEPAYYDACSELLGGVKRDLETLAGELLAARGTVSAAERRQIQTELPRLGREVRQLERLLAAARDFYAGGWQIAGDGTPYSADAALPAARLLVCQG